MPMIKKMSGSKKSTKKVKVFKHYQKKSQSHHKTLKKMFQHEVFDKSRLPKFLKEAM
jgi:hypothetical protein